MSIIFTGDIAFKNKLFNVLRKNESGSSRALGSEDTAYVLTAPGSSNSGWSFGYIQYDLSTGNADGIKLFTDILLNAVDTNGKYIVDDGDPTTDREHDKKVAELLSKAKLKGGLGVTGGLTTDDVNGITLALSSTYGKGKIDGSVDDALQKLVEYADAVKKAASQADQTFLKKDIARLFLCDYANQFGCPDPVNYPKDPWIKFVQGRSFNGYIKNGVLGVDDLLNAYFRTKEAQKVEGNYLGANTVLKRFAAVVQEAGGYTPTDIDEAKGVLRAYTYLYVPHESQLLATQARINNLKDFRRAVNRPAEQMMLDNWKPEWGTRPVSVDSYDDMLMGDDNANYNDSGDYQLNGRDGDDIIFAEGGDDHIEGGKGDDILLGGKGHDTYIYTIGDGNDRIIDEDKDGKIVIFDTNGTEINRRALGNFYKSGENEWKLPDGSKITVSHNSPYKITLPDGNTIELGENFQDGDFGIHLLDAPTDPTTTNTILGDQNPDNKDDELSDTSLNDWIEGQEGNDTISAFGGGDDVLLGGDGRDAISAGAGNDTAEGNAGADILMGGLGDDRLFGENFGEMETIIAAGETAQSINQKGDLLSGGAGNDMVYGSNKKDALFGGEGESNIIFKLAA